MSERDLIDEFLLASSKRGWRFSRNNSGLAHFENGSTVRYGLFVPGGSDTIGWIPYKVQAADVGQTLPLFSAVELKTGKQSPTEDQLRFLRIVERAGGFAAWGRDCVAIFDKLEKQGAT
jgi:hypothetical protein